MRLTKHSGLPDQRYGPVGPRRGDGACSGCGGERDRRSQRYCKRCHAAKMRVHRARHSQLSPEQRYRANVRSYANVYQRRGILTPEPCLECGSPLAEKHHPDYSQPLVVIWLCRRHHLSTHR